MRRFIQAKLWDYSAPLQEGPVRNVNTIPRSWMSSPTLSNSVSRSGIPRHMDKTFVHFALIT